MPIQAGDSGLSPDSMASVSSVSHAEIAADFFPPTCHNAVHQADKADLL